MNEPQEPSKIKSEKDRSFRFRVLSRNDPRNIRTLDVEAPTEEAATQKLFAQGYIVVGSEERGGGETGLPMNLSQKMSSFFGKKNQGGPPSFFQRVSSRETTFLAIQLSTLLNAGVQLLRGLDIIEKGLTNLYFKEVIRQVRQRVSEGAVFSKVLAGYPKVFSWSWVNLTEVGEATGKLPSCLEEIAHYQEATARVKQKVVTAFFYPGVLTVAVVAALTFLLLVVVPKFTAIFIAQKMELPLLTQIIVGISDVLRKQFLWVFLVGVGAVVGLAQLNKNPLFRIGFDRVILGAPIFGPILLQVAVVRFTRSLGTLLRSGVQILQALDISGRLVENKFFESEIKQVALKVKSGQGLGIQLEARKVFPVFVTQLLVVGEESGQLERFLDLLAKYYEEQVDTFLARLTTLLEPVILVFMGSVIGTIVISMFLPIIELSTRGGGGG